MCWAKHQKSCRQQQPDAAAWDVHEVPMGCVGKIPTSDATLTARLIHTTSITLRQGMNHDRMVIV